MPGPSGLPNTLASYGGGLHSAAQSNDCSPHSLDAETNAHLTYQSLEAEAACSDKLLDSAAVKLHPEAPMQQCLMDKHPRAAQSCVSLQPETSKASKHTGAAGSVAEAKEPAFQQQAAQQTLLLCNGKPQAGPMAVDASAQRLQCPVELATADPSQSSQQPAASPTVASNGVASARHSQQPMVMQTGGASDAVFPVHGPQPAATPTHVHNQQTGTSETHAAKDDASPVHSQQISVTPMHAADDDAPFTLRQHLAATHTTAANDDNGDDDNNSVDCATPMHAAAHEDTTVPDSVGLTQHGRHSHHQRQALHIKSPSSSEHSHAPSDNASLEAALALAALASGEKQAARAQPSTADHAELSTRSCRQQWHQQCDSSRVPLKTIQRSAVQRQPLKPAWQHSGRAEASCGAKGQRTRTRMHPHKPPQRGRTAVRHSRDAKHMQRGKDKQASGSQAVGVSHSGLGSDCTEDEVDIASKPSQNRGVPPGSNKASNQAVPSRAQLVGSKQPGRRQRSKETSKSTHDDLKQASGSSLTQVPEQAHTQQLQLRNDNGEAASNANVDNGNDDDDDDFKPDVRRQPKSHRSSPKGSRNRPRLSQPRACPDSTAAEADSGAKGNPVGQVLLSWDGMQCCWNQRIITAFSASKVRVSVQ